MHPEEADFAVQPPAPPHQPPVVQPQRPHGLHHTGSQEVECIGAEDGDGPGGLEDGRTRAATGAPHPVDLDDGAALVADAAAAQAAAAAGTAADAAAAVPPSPGQQQAQAQAMHMQPLSATRPAAAQAAPTALAVRFTLPPAHAPEAPQQQAEEAGGWAGERDVELAGAMGRPLATRRGGVLTECKTIGTRGGGGKGHALKGREGGRDWDQALGRGG